MFTRVLDPLGSLPLTGLVNPLRRQTASVGVATSRYVRNEGEVICHNRGWTFILLGYLIMIGVAFCLAAPKVMTQ